MDSRRILLALVLTLLVASEPGAQTRVRTETIIPPANLAPPADSTAPSATAPAPAPGAPATPLQLGPAGITPPAPPPPVAAPKPLPPVRLPPIGSPAQPHAHTRAPPGAETA